MLVTCPHCSREIEINPASMLGSLPKTLTPAALAAKSANGKKGGWPKGRPRKVAE